MQTSGKAPQKTESFDDCGVAIESNPSDSTQQYPRTLNEFMYGFYNNLTQPSNDIASPRSAINHLATEVEEDANRLAGETQIGICEMQVLEETTDYFKLGFAYIAKRATEMAETATDAYFYEAIAAVSALGFAVMANEEQEEQASIESLEVLEHDFETVGEVAEIIREATADHKIAPKLGGY